MYLHRSATSAPQVESACVTTSWLTIAASIGLSLTVILRASSGTPLIRLCGKSKLVTAVLVSCGVTVGHR